jgi:nucleotide-binding universal stress UspA family protein
MKYNSKVLILHVVPPPTAFFGPMEAPWMGGAEIEKVSERPTKDSLKRLEEVIPNDLREACRPELMVREGAPSATILDLAREREAELVVVGAHGHGKSDLGWVGSTCHRVMRAAKSPVLAVRPRI